MIAAAIMLIARSTGNARKAAKRAQARKARATVDTSPGQQPPLPYNMSAQWGDQVSPDKQEW
jgi:hypothetical protein